MPLDPYYHWLGIPPGEQPPNHYRLLGLTLFETHLEAICNAADRQMAHVRTFQSGPQAALSQQILREIAVARICLLDPAKKAAYDAELRAKVVPPELPEPLDVTVAPPPVAIARVAEHRRTNVVVHAAKIAGGGIAGMLVLVLLLRHAFLIDVTGLLPLRSTVPSQQLPERTPEVRISYQEPEARSQKPEDAQGTATQGKEPAAGQGIAAEPSTNKSEGKAPSPAIEKKGRKKKKGPPKPSATPPVSSDTSNHGETALSTTNSTT